jgi:DUF1365 family protein
VNSRLYVGKVMHQRTRPVKNAFRYGIYFLFADLDELDLLDGGLSLFGHNHGALVSLWDEDHGPRDGSPLRPWIDELLGQVGIDLTGGKVYLLAFPRVLGFKFWPASFWYCFSADGTPMAVLAEVQNTFRDHHNYLLHNNGQPFDWNSRPGATKAFYVSPFIQIEDARYEFHFSEPGEKLSASIYDYVSGPLLLTAAISVNATELTDRALLGSVLRLGPMSARALVLIHYQAVKLWLKRVPFFRHVPPPTQETSL